MSLSAPHQRVLVVAADMLLRKLVRALLVDAGYDVAAASSAGAATSFLAAECVDLIVLHDSLPQMDSLAFCGQLRVAQIAAAILYISSDQADDATVTASEAGIDDWLPAPFDPRDLPARAAAALRRRRGLNTNRRLPVAGERSAAGARAFSGSVVRLAAVPLPGQFLLMP